MIFAAAMLFVMSLSARENLDRNGKIAKDFKARRELVTGNGYFDVFENLSGSRLQPGLGAESTVARGPGCEGGWSSPTVSSKQGARLSEEVFFQDT